MSNYLISLDKDRMERLSIPFCMTYANGNEIDFNKEGIGVLVSVEVKNIPSFIELAIAEKGLQEEYAGYSFGPVVEGKKYGWQLKWWKRLFWILLRCLQRQSFLTLFYNWLRKH